MNVWLKKDKKQSKQKEREMRQFVLILLNVNMVIGKTPSHEFGIYSFSGRGF